MNVEEVYVVTCMELLSGWKSTGFRQARWVNISYLWPI